MPTRGRGCQGIRRSPTSPGGAEDLEANHQYNGSQYRQDRGGKRMEADATREAATEKAIQKKLQRTIKEMEMWE